MNIFIGKARKDILMASFGENHLYNLKKKRLTHQLNEHVDQKIHYFEMKRNDEKTVSKLHYRFLVVTTTNRLLIGLGLIPKSNRFLLRMPNIYRKSIRRPKGSFLRVITDEQEQK